MPRSAHAAATSSDRIDATRLGDVGDAVPVRFLDVVDEGERTVGHHRHARERFG